MPEAEREHFYKHMGHSKSVNLGTYQYPLPLLEMTKVGRHLEAIDECNLMCKFHYTLICYTYIFILNTYYCISTYNVYLSNVALSCLDDIATDDVQYLMML